MLKFRALLIAGALVSQVLFFVGSASAATYVWNATGGSTWSASSNWISGGVPGLTDVGQFAGSGYTSQPTLGSAASIGGLWVTGSGAVTVGGSTITLYGTNINSNTGTSIEMDAGAGSLTISAPVTLAATQQQWINNSGNPLSVGGVLVTVHGFS